MTKILTIVVPAYNTEQYLDQCLASVAKAQRLSDIEVLVVDDGGTDTSLEIARTYEHTYPNSFHAVHKDNGGHGSVINYGVDHAQGIFLKVLDGDDWVDPVALDGLIELLTHTEADIIASDYECIQDGTGQCIERRHVASISTHYGRFCSWDEASMDPVLKIHSLTIRTTLLRENGVRFDEHCFYEDAELSTFPIPFAQGVLFDDHCVYKYRLGREGQSVNIDRLVANREQHERVILSLLAFSDIHQHIDPSAQRALNRTIAYYTQNQYQIYLKMGTQSEALKELRAFDQMLKEHYPSIYTAVTKKSIQILRASNMMLFPFACIVYRLIKGK